MNTHFKLENEVLIDYEIIIKSPLHIGSGIDEGSNKDSKRVITYKLNDEDVPYIPGSSIKGILRSDIERMIRASDKYFSCDPLDDSTSCGKIIMKENKDKHITELSYDKIIEKINLRKKKIASGLCIVCRLFGTHVFKGMINIGDAIPNKSINIGKKTSTAINRDTGDVKRGALFTVDFVHPEQSFFSRIKISDISKDNIRYIAAALRNLNLGFTTLGGYSTKGFGLVNIKISRVIKNTGILNNPIITKVEDTDKLLNELIERGDI